MARRRATENADKAAVEVAVKADRAKTPMERFRAVGRRTVVVSPDELAEQQRAYEESTTRRGRIRPSN
jgi:hypothetical protein